MLRKSMSFLVVLSLLSACSRGGTGDSSINLAALKKAESSLPGSESEPSSLAGLSGGPAALQSTSGPESSAASSSSQSKSSSSDNSMRSMYWFLGTMGVIAATILIADLATKGDVLGLFGPGKDKKATPQSKPQMEDPNCPPQSGPTTDIQSAQEVLKENPT